MVPSLYIHIPFCKRKCFYCDFYSLVYESAAAGRYIDAILRQIARLDRRFDTIYIGGGTPTALDRELLEKLLRGIGKNISDTTEFTVEANPESLDADKMDLLLDLGVNRLSIGLQSLDDRILKKLGRIHSAATAVDAVRLAAKKGFPDISVDLIFGVWGQEPGSWEDELEEAVKLPVGHISAYALTHEKDVPLFEALKNKSVTPLEEDVVAAMYEVAIDKLALRGFKQYEISNFTKDLRRCRHNLNYWDNSPYLGLGASAVSYIDGVRTRNISDAAGYAAGVYAGRTIAESSEKLSPVRRAKETAAIKIRTKDGIDFGWFKEKTGFDFMKLERDSVAGLVEKGLIRYKKDGSTPVGIALKRKGFLFCDTVSSALL